MVHNIIAHIILAVAITVMGYTLSQTNKLLTILKGSKAEPIWKRSQIGLILLTGSLIILMITQLIGAETFFSNTNHNILMNSSFLLISFLVLNLVNLDIQAFSSLFELLTEEE